LLDDAGDGVGHRSCEHSDSSSVSVTTAVRIACHAASSKLFVVKSKNAPPRLDDHDRTSVAGERDDGVAEQSLPSKAHAAPGCAADSRNGADFGGTVVAAGLLRE